jgi:hypothetical protein
VGQHAVGKRDGEELYETHAAGEWFHTAVVDMPDETVESTPSHSMETHILRAASRSTHHHQPGCDVSDEASLLRNQVLSRVATKRWERDADLEFEQPGHGKVAMHPIWKRTLSVFSRPDWLASSD